MGIDQPSNFKRSLPEFGARPKTSGGTQSQVSGPGFPSVEKTLTDPVSVNGWQENNSAGQAAQALGNIAQAAGSMALGIKKQREKRKSATDAVLLAQLKNDYTIQNTERHRNLTAQYQENRWDPTEFLQMDIQGLNEVRGTLLGRVQDNEDVYNQFAEWSTLKGTENQLQSMATEQQLTLLQFREDRDALRSQAGSLLQQVPTVENFETLIQQDEDVTAITIGDRLKDLRLIEAANTEAKEYRYQLATSLVLTQARKGGLKGLKEAMATLEDPRIHKYLDEAQSTALREKLQGRLDSEYSAIRTQKREELEQLRKSYITATLSNEDTSNIDEQVLRLQSEGMLTEEDFAEFSLAREMGPAYASMVSVAGQMTNQQLQSRLDSMDPRNQAGTPQGPSTGLIERGTIDLTNRPKVVNGDGSISTVLSFSTNIDDKEVLLPLISPDGDKWTQAQAIDNYLLTGEHLGIFDSPDAATAYANRLHDSQAATLPGEDFDQRVKLHEQFSEAVMEQFQLLEDDPMRAAAMQGTGALNEAQHRLKVIHEAKLARKDLKSLKLLTKAQSEDILNALENVISAGNYDGFLNFERQFLNGYDIPVAPGLTQKDIILNQLSEQPGSPLTDEGLEAMFMVDRKNPNSPLNRFLAQAVFAKGKEIEQMEQTVDMQKIRQLLKDNPVVKGIMQSQTFSTIRSQSRTAGQLSLLAKAAGLAVTRRGIKDEESAVNQIIEDFLPYQPMSGTGTSNTVSTMTPPVPSIGTLQAGVVMTFGVNTPSQTQPGTVQSVNVRGDNLLVPKEFAGPGKVDMQTISDYLLEKLSDEQFIFEKLNFFGVTQPPPAPEQLFHEVFQGHTIASEGTALVKDSNKHWVKYGINGAWNTARAKKELIRAGRPAAEVDKMSEKEAIGALTPEMAERISYQYYWAPSRSNQIPDPALAMLNYEMYFLGGELLGQVKSRVPNYEKVFSLPYTDATKFERQKLFNTINEARLSVLKTYKDDDGPQWPRYGASWTNRGKSIPKYADKIGKKLYGPLRAAALAPGQKQILRDAIKRMSKNMIVRNTGDLGSIVIGTEAGRNDRKRFAPFEESGTQGTQAWTVTWQELLNFKAKRNAPRN